MLYQLIALILVAAGLLLVQIISAFIQGKPRDKIWDSIDAVGVSPRGGALSWAVALLKSVTLMQENMLEGYQKYSKAGKPFALPTMWMGGALVVLPVSMFNLLNKPRNELSSFDALLDNIQFRYLMTDKDVWGNTIHFEIVRKQLNQKGMNAVATIMSEEWNQAFRTIWGDSKQGKVVNAWETSLRIIERAALRVMVGLPECRDEEYLELSMLYANAVLTDACLINCMPPIIRPVGGRLLALRARYHSWKLLRILTPMVEEKMRRYHDKGSRSDESEDAIQWLIEVAKNHGPEQMSASKIAQRVLALTPMFVFAIGWVFTHVVLDLYSTSSTDNAVRILEAECQRVSAKHGGLSTKEAVDELYCIDSAIRESMRLNDVMVDLLPLDVIAGEGIDLGDGRKISAGSGVRTVFPAQMVHRDPDVYSNPDEYDAFRFSRDFDGSQPDESTSRPKRRELMTTVTRSFLPFGYGRHTCPGRWLVAYMVKEALAHVVLNYNVEVTKRPPRKRSSLLNFMFPPLEATIHVTRKDHSSTPIP